jgi:Xaa-Pro aminopeptidase
MLDDRAWAPPDRWEVAQENLIRLRRAMKDHGIDAFFLNRSDAVRYVAGTIPSDNLIFSQRVGCLVLVEQELPILFAQAHGADFLKGHFWIQDIRPLPRIQDIWPRLITEALADYGLDPEKCTIGLDATMEAYPFKLMERKLPGASCDKYWSVMNKCRAVKSEKEISCVEHACILGEMSIDAGVRMMRVGITEIELAAEMSRVAVAAGAEGLYARRGTVVTSGPKIPRLDETPSRRRLRYGDMVLIDVGPIVNGYYTDFARTVCLGKPNKNAAQAFSVAYDAVQLAIELFKPGIEGTVAAHEVVNFVRSRFPTNTALGPIFVAHGVGTASQEPPYFLPVEENAQTREMEHVEPNMVLSLSVGVYGDEVGCRHEEVIAITDTGNRLLSRSPYYGFNELYIQDDNKS